MGPLHGWSEVSIFFIYIVEEEKAGGEERLAEAPKASSMAPQSSPKASPKASPKLPQSSPKPLTSLASSRFFAKNLSQFGILRYAKTLNRHSKNIVRYAKIVFRGCKSAVRYVILEIRLPPLWAHMDFDVPKCYKVCKKKWHCNHYGLIWISRQPWRPKDQLYR